MNGPTGGPQRSEREMIKKESQPVTDPFFQVVQTKHLIPQTLFFATILSEVKEI
jgi:hypothetical protein